MYRSTRASLKSSLPWNQLLHSGLVGRRHREEVAEQMVIGLPTHPIFLLTGLIPIIFTGCVMQCGIHPCMTCKTLPRQPLQLHIFHFHHPPEDVFQSAGLCPWCQQARYLENYLWLTIFDPWFHPLMTFPKGDSEPGLNKCWSTSKPSSPLDS